MASMDLLKIVGDYFLSAWIWSFTFDWFHPIITGVTMFLIFRVITHRTRLKALAISMGAQVIVLVILTALIGWMTEGLQWRYEPFDIYTRKIFMPEFTASLAVGLVYTFIQTMSFLIGRFFFRYSIVTFLVATILSNIIGVGGSYLLIRITEAWNYIS